MGMDLVGAGGYCYWTGAAWGEILQLGEEFGWEPIGTGPSKGERKANWFPGSYFGNDTQLFYARDAKRLADALERALAAIPVQLRPKPTRLKTRSKRGQPAPQYFNFAGEVIDLDKPGALMDALNRAIGKKGRKRGPRKDRYLTPGQAADIRELIEFCRAGSFRIY